jgi:hypothetical protein
MQSAISSRNKNPLQVVVVAYLFEEKLFTQRFRYNPPQRNAQKQQQRAI